MKPILIFMGGVILGRMLAGEQPEEAITRTVKQMKETIESGIKTQPKVGLVVPDNRFGGCGGCW